MKLSVQPNCCACSYCYRTCPVGAPYFDSEQTRINMQLCIQCGACIQACPLGAIYDAEQPPASVSSHPPVHDTCDALIVGAGASGMTAAVRLAEAGKRVIVLEKEKKTGSGALHVAGPMQIIDTKWALEAGEPPKAPQKIQETLAYGRGYLNPALVEKTILALPRFFDWLCTFSDATKGFVLTHAKPVPPLPPGPPLPDGVVLPDGLTSAEEPQDAIIAGGGMPGSAMSGNTGLIVEAKSYRPDSPAFHNAGEFIMTQLFRRARELGVRILHQTSAQQLLKGDDGTITGVLASDPGGLVEISCSVCLLATGSLLLSDAVKQIEPEFADCFQPRYGHTIQAYTGDGFAMCQQAGIPVRYEDIWLNITGSLVMPCDGLTVEYAEAARKRPMMPPDLRGHSNRPESLMVNLKGERYQNEQMSNISVRPQMRQPQGLSYTILSQRQIQSQPLPWIPVPDANGKPMRTLLPPGMPTLPWNEEHMNWLASLKGKHLVVADTISELAARAGIDSDRLVRTVERYNDLCRAGQDTDFGKHPFYLHPMEEGPFYAIRTFLMSDGAQGGIPIDENCRVQGVHQPIANLFAAGDNSSGNIVITPEHEKLWITNEFSWALSSGMIASDSMLSQLEA